MISKFLNNKLFLFISSVFIVSFVINFNNFTGDKFFFLIFHICGATLTMALFRKNITSFEFFLYIFFLLSFWLKFSYLLYIDKVGSVEGNFDINKINFDLILLIIIFTFSSCIIATLLREKIVQKLFIKKKKFKLKKNVEKFYLTNRYLIFFSLTILLVVFYTMNIMFNIHIKGIQNDKIPILIKYLFSWGYTYGFSFVVSFLIFLDFILTRKKAFFYLSVFESFFTSITMYSRAFILVFFAYFRGFYELDKNNFIKNIKKILNFKIILAVIFLFFVSILISSKLRLDNYMISSNKEFSLKSQFFHIADLSIKRWIGIDGLIAVTQNENLNFELFVSSLSEKKSINKYESFYIDNFFDEIKISNNPKLENPNLYLVVTPGIVAFLYYSGSIFFIILSLIVIIIFCSILERLFLHISKGNIILCNIIGYSLAFRLMHFGYIPANTFKFLLSYFIILIFMGILFKFITDK